VIDGIINHEAGYLQSKESVDIYSTKEPQLAFTARIQFCLDIHNEAIKVHSRFIHRLALIDDNDHPHSFFLVFLLINKAMRYPPTTNKEVDEERLDREKQQEDLVKAIDEEDIGDDFF
jgi:26S proteasome regulatory subunit N3